MKGGFYLDAIFCCCLEVERRWEGLVMRFV